MASIDQPAVLASTGAGESSSMTTTTTTMTVSQTTLTSVLTVSWSVLLPQFTATIRKEVGETMQRANTTPAAAASGYGMSGTLFNK